MQSSRMNRDPLQTRFTGSMVGSALGDAIGELAFATPDRRLLERRVQEALILRYTDDLSLIHI